MNIFLFYFFIFFHIIYANDVQEINIPKSDRLVKVPKLLWDVLKKNLENEGMTEKKFLQTEQIKSPVELTLTEKSEAILNGKDMKFTLKMGGNVDLADYLIKKRGEFSLSIKPFFPDGTPMEDYHLFYISYAKERQELNQTWGNGCDRIMDLTSSSDVFEKGILTTVAKQNYFSLFGGMYIVIKYANDKIYLSHVEVNDKRYPHLYCDFVRNF